MEKLKILELTNFSAGACGVFARVIQESIELKKLGYEVRVFSSNLEKGTNKIVNNSAEIQGIKISRFPAKQLGGESYMKWFSKESEKLAVTFKPDVIIAHSYRHKHTHSALDLGKKINSKVFLVTHAPFGRNRGFTNNIIVSLYDFFLGRRKLKKFNKVIAITKWEISYLEKLGLERDRIVYIPNGIPNIFFTQKPKKEQNKILFFGRISPIKNLETLIKSIHFLSDKKITLEIVGPAEEDYKLNLISLIKNLKVESRVVFYPAVYDLKEKIEKIDSCKIFVLPSFSEGMPQSLIEAMARKKIVISSDNLGGKELIENNSNGFIFETGDYNQLAEVIDKSIDLKDKKIQAHAEKSVEKFKWSILIKNLESLFN